MRLKRMLGEESAARHSHSQLRTTQEAHGSRERTTWIARVEASDQFEPQVTSESVGCDNSTSLGVEWQTQSTTDEIMKPFENQIQDERCNHSTNKSEVMNCEKSITKNIWADLEPLP